MSEKHVNIKITASTSGFDNAIKKAQKQIDSLAKDIEDLGGSKFGGTLESQFNDLVKALKEAEEQISNVQKVLDDLGNSKLGKTEKELDGIKDKMKTLTESGEKVVKCMDDIQDTLSKVDKGDLGGLDKSFTKVKSTVEDLGKEMRDATDNIEKNFSNLAEGADKFSREINNIDGSGLNKVVDSIKDIDKHLDNATDSVSDFNKKLDDINTKNFNEYADFIQDANKRLAELSEKQEEVNKNNKELDSFGINDRSSGSNRGKDRDYDSKNKGGNNFTSALTEGFVSGTIAANTMQSAASDMANSAREISKGFEGLTGPQGAIQYFHDLNDAVAENKNRIDELNKSYEDYNNKKKQNEEDLKVAKEQKKAWEAEKAASEQAKKVAKEAYEEQIEKAKELNDIKEKSRKVIDTYNNSIKEQKERILEANKAIEDQKKKLSDIEKEYNDYNDAAEKNLADMEKLGEGMGTDNISRTVKEYKELDDAVTDIRAKMTDLEKIHADEENKLKNLEAQRELYSNITEAIKNNANAVADARKEYKAADEELKGVNEEARRLKKISSEMVDTDFFNGIMIDEFGNQISKATKEAAEFDEEIKKLQTDIKKYSDAISESEKEAQGYADSFEKQYNAYESLSKRVKAYLEDEGKSILQREKVAKSFKNLSDEMEKVYADSKKFNNIKIIDDTFKEAAEYIDKLDLSSTENLQRDLERLGEIIDDKTKKIKRFKELNKEFGSEDSKKAFGLEKQSEQLMDYARNVDFVIEAVDELNKAFAQVKVGDDDNLRIKGRMELLQNYGDLLAKTAADIRNKYHDIAEAEDVYKAATPQEKAELDKYKNWQENRKEIEKYTKAIDEYRAAIKDMGGQVDNKFLDELGKFDARKFIEDFDKMGTSSAVLQKQFNANKIALLEWTKAEKEKRQSAVDTAKANLNQAKADKKAAEGQEEIAKATEKVAKAQEELAEAKKKQKSFYDDADKEIKQLNEYAEKLRKIGMAAQDIEKADIGKFNKSLASILDGKGTFGNDIAKNFADIKEDVWAVFEDMDSFDFGDAFDGLKEVGAGILSMIPGKAKLAAAAIGLLTKALKECAEAGVNQFGEGISTIGNVLSNVVGVARDIGQEVRDAFENITGMQLDASSLMEIPVEFESVMYQVGAITGTLFDATTGKADNTNAAFQELVNKARDVGSETRYSATEAAEAMVLLGQSGWTARDMMEGLDAVLHMATIENMSLADSASFLSDALNTMNMQTYQASDAADMLVATSISANTSVSQLKNAYGNAASTAGTLGVSMSDLNVVLGAMADKGIKGAKAGTALKNLMANMAAPTEKQTKCIKEYNLEAAQTAITNGKLVEGIQLMQGQLEGLSAKQKTAVITTIAGKHALSGVAALMNTSAEDMNKLRFAVDSSTKSSKKYAESLGLIDKAGNMIDKTTGKITDSFTDMKNSQGKAYDQWVNFNDIMNSTDEAGNSLVDIMQVVGGTATDLGAVVHKLGEDGSVTKEEVGEIVEVFNKLNEAAQDGSSVLSEFGIEIAENSEGTIDFSETLKNLGEKWDTLTDAQKASMAEQLGFSGSIEELNELFADNGEQIENLITAYEEMEGVAEHVAEAFDANFKGSLLSLASAMQEQLLQVFDKIKPSIQGVVEELTEFFRILNNKGQDNTGLSGLSGALEYLEKTSQGWKKALTDNIANAIGEINNFLNSVSFDNLLQVGTNIIDGIADGIQRAADNGSLDNAISTAIRKVGTWFSENLDTIVEVGGEVVEAICQGISENEDVIGEAIKSVIDMQTDIESAINYAKWEVIGQNIGTFIGKGISSTIVPFFSGLEGFGDGAFVSPINTKQNKRQESVNKKNSSVSDTLKSWGLSDGWADGIANLFFPGAEKASEKGKEAGQAYTEGAKSEISNQKDAVNTTINDNFKEAKVQTDMTASEIGTGISDNIMAKLETMDASGLQALSLELQNLQTTTEGVAVGLSTSFTQIQDASRVSFMGLTNIVRNQMLNCTNIVRNQALNMSNIFRNQFLSMANIARNQMVNVSNIIRNQAVSWSNVIRNQVTNARNALTSQFLSMAAVARTQMVNISNIVRNQAMSWANIIRNQAANARNALTSSFMSMAAVARTQMANVLSVVRSYMSQIVAATNRTMTMNFKVNRTITTTNVTKSVSAPASASYNARALSADALYAANTASTFSLGGGASTLASRASSAISYSGSNGSVSSGNGEAMIFELPTYLDGKVVARTTAKYVDGELKVIQKRDDRKRGVK
jgi:TP901 family phage tail tape measure protein